MEPKNNLAFVSRKHNGNTATLTFNLDSSYEMPVNLLTSDISQFQSVLTCASKLIDLEKSISNDFIKDTLFSEYARGLEDKHKSDCLLLEQQVTSKLSPLMETMNDKEKSFAEQMKQLRSDYELQIKIDLRKEEGGRRCYCHKNGI